MEIPKLIILLCCTYCTIASHSTHHTIPVEGYDTELQDLGQHVEIPETPVRVIKITKTVAVKIPVPYPVKIREKVPYPVHVAKPYPVPVPQIIKVPHVGHQPSHEQDSGYGGNLHGGQGGGAYNPYQVQEDEHLSGGQSFGPASGHSFEGSHSGQGHGDEADFLHEGTPTSFHSNGYQGYSGNVGDPGNDELNSYDQAINDYFKKQQNSNAGGTNGYHY